jgi:hypothetical protein
VVRMFLGCVLVTLAAAPAAPGQDANAPRWQFKKDQTIKYLFKMKEIRTVVVAAQKFVATTEHEVVCRWTVLDVGEDGALLELKFDALKAAVTAKDFEFAYESGRDNSTQIPEKKKLNNLYDQVAFGKYRLRVDSRGRITELSGLTKLAEDLSDDATTDVYGLGLRDGTLAWFLQETMGVLPEVSPSPKEPRWKRSFQKQTEPGQLSGEGEFTLAERDKDGFTARHRGQATLEVDMKWSGSTLRGELKTTRLEGKHAWDGSLRSGEARIDVGGTLKLNDSTDLRVTYEYTLELTRQP